MSTLPSTPRAGPSCPSHPHLWPVITTPTQPCIEDKDLEIAALTKKFSALQEKRAQEEEEERKARQVVKKVWQEELERVKVVEAKRRVAEIAREQGVGRKWSPTPEMEGDHAECM